MKIHGVEPRCVSDSLIPIDGKDVITDKWYYKQALNGAESK